MALKFAVRAPQVGVNNVYPAGFDGVLVTPNDGADLPNGACIGFCVTGTTGNVAINTLNSIDPSLSGGTALFTGVVSGGIVLCNTKRILATGTTATNIYALYNNG